VGDGGGKLPRWRREGEGDCRENGGGVSAFRFLVFVEEEVVVVAVVAAVVEDCRFRR